MLLLACFSGCAQKGVGESRCDLHMLLCMVVWPQMATSSQNCAEGCWRLKCCFPQCRDARATETNSASIGRKRAQSELRERERERELLKRKEKTKRAASAEHCSICLPACRQQKRQLVTSAYFRPHLIALLSSTRLLVCLGCPFH